MSYLTFDRYQRMLQRAFNKEANVSTKFVAGAAAGATATTLTYREHAHIAVH